jgi:glucose/arabinose dehydrogenase
MKSRRLAWLLLALVATAALAAFGDGSGTAPAPADPAGSGTLRVRPLLARLAVPAIAADPFNPSPAPAAQPEANATPAPPAAAQPARPTPAPLPYRVIGKQLDDAGWTVFLASGEATLIVREGDLLDASHQVASIRPPALVLRHLASGARRTLDIGNAQE